MSSKRTVVVCVAVAVGVLASVLSYVFLNNAQNDAYHNAKLVSAYVITKPIPRTLSGADVASGGYLQQKKIPAEFRPSSAVTDLSAIKDDSADANLPAGEIVVSGMFASPETIASVAAETVPAGDVAISVSVDPVHGVAGLIHPGDKVDILVDLNGTQETYLFQAVPVLAVGTTLVPTPGTASSASSSSSTQTTSNVITFAVSPADAARIALADSDGGGVTGGIYLALEAAGNSAAAPTTINSSNLIPASTTGSAPAATGSTPVSASPTTVPAGTSGGANEKDAP